MAHNALSVSPILGPFVCFELVSCHLTRSEPDTPLLPDGWVNMPIWAYFEKLQSGPVSSSVAGADEYEAHNFLAKINNGHL